MLRFCTTTESTLGVSDSLEVAHPHAVLRTILVSLPLLHCLSDRYVIVELIHRSYHFFILDIDRGGVWGLYLILRHGRSKR
jgi:hypothetical protein